MSGHDQTVNPVTDIEEHGELHKWWLRSSAACAKPPADAMKAWTTKASELGHKLTDQVTEKALSFGHGAREAYSKVDAWGADLEQKLEADWKQAGNEGHSTWEKVRAAVQHGWECCADAAGAALKKSDDSKLHNH